MAKSRPAAWKSLGQRQVADCRVFRVQRRRLRHARDGRTGDFFIIQAPDWVHTLALTPKRELIMVRQWRFGVEKLSWEPPGGVTEPRENIVAAAKRELLEETGYAGKKARVIGSASPNPALQNNRVHFVLVENCKPAAELAWDQHEELEMALYPLAEVRRMVRRGEIIHSLALNALQFLFLELDSRKAR